MNLFNSTHYFDLIHAKKKKSGLTREQIFSFAKAVHDAAWPDYQIAALLMAIRLQGMSFQETVWLTQAMAYFSEKLSNRANAKITVDKHSTGGVGDGVSLVLAPLAASLGLKVPMMSGRSLGLTGGTLDKLEAIPGMKTRLDKRAIEKQIRTVGLAMFGQTERMAPVDRKLYALRDAIGAVDSLPLIVSSIVSKKLTEGLSGIVFDVKFGRGAIFECQAEALRLAKALVSVAQGAGLRARACLTRMEEPLGRAAGSALETRQAWEILNGRTRGLEDYMEVTFELLFHMLSLAGKVKGKAESDRMAYKAIATRAALAKFQAMLMAQGVSQRTAGDVSKSLPFSPRVWQIKSPSTGWVDFVDARLTAEATLALGALRKTAEDAVDPVAGARLLKKRGEPVAKGEALAELHAGRAGEQECKIAEEAMLKAFRFSKTKPKQLLTVVQSGI